MKINARQKGHNYERKIVGEMRELGYKDCETSRYANKKLDDMKVDLTDTDPFSIQCKAVESGINYFKLLDSMPSNDNMNIVMHKKNRQGEIVVMNKETFYKLLRKYKEKIWNSEKGI